jgi:hypothetical protein
MRPCTSCGVGVGNVVGLCGACDYNKVENKLRMRRVRAVEKEFMRLASIDISY